MILPMVPEDLDEVLVIEVESFPKPWSRDIFEKEIQNPVAYSFSGKVAAGDQELLAAYIVFWIVHGESHILNLTVRSDYQRHGFARRLMDFTLNFMRENGVSDVFLEVRRSNDAAIALYERFGFRELYVRKKYYGNEDALVMGLALQGDDNLWESR